MNNFFNQHNEIVSEALLGLVKASADSGFEMLDGLPHIKCAIASDRDSSKVAVLSGGGAGHEPAHAGYVGKGMLTGAISGEIFASPSVDAVLAAILHVASEAGCLLIVKNYTGDRLNFGLAAERAKNLGFNVEMVIVGDDISIPDSKQPRGIAGTLFIHKMAGYYSEQGLSLSEMKQRLDNISNTISSIGVAYSSCHLPGQELDSQEKENTAELGLGIHGEAGVEVFDPQNAKATVDMVVSRLKQTLSGDEKLAVLINNLGAASNLEMSVVMNDLLSSEIADNIELVFGPQTYMTALDMHGFSLSIVPLTEDIRSGLKAPTAVKSWRPYSTVSNPEMVPLNDALAQNDFSSSHDALTDDLVQQVCALLIDQEGHLNDLDAKVGDGDTGTTFANGAKAVLSKLQGDGLPMRKIDELFLTIGNQLSTAMGGSSGVLLSIFFTAAGNAYKEGSNVASSLQLGLDTVSKYGGAKLGDRTMLDAAIPAIQSMVNGADIKAAAEEAVKGADATADILNAKAGRSSYLRAESLVGVKDPGAVAVAMIFEKMANVAANY